MDKTLQNEKNNNKRQNNNNNMTENKSVNKKNSRKRIGVLFACLGNVCRSPMAEAVFIHEVTQRHIENKFLIDSCGTASKGFQFGRKPDSRTLSVCKNNNININHCSRRIITEDFYRFDYIFGMDSKNFENLTKLAPDNARAKIQLFSEYDPEHETEIIDPFFSKGIDSFNHTFEQVTRCSLGFLDYLGLKRN